MNALNNRQLSSLVSISLKTAGIIMIAAAVIDMVVLPIPYQFQSREWLITFTTQIVDRGIIPMLGVVLIIAANWIDSLAENHTLSKTSWRTLQFWALIFASVFAALYMLITVVHISNVLIVRGERLETIATQAGQAEQQLTEQINAQVGQQRQRIEQLVGSNQIQELLSNAQLREQAIAQGAITEENLNQLEEFQDDPDLFYQQLEDRALEEQARAQAEIGVRREEEQQEVKTNATKSLLRIGLSSIILAIGYGIIGWIGLRFNLKG